MAREIDPKLEDLSQQEREEIEREAQQMLEYQKTHPEVGH